MDYLTISGKCYVVFGIANKKSIATAIARNLVEQGAEVILVVRSEERRKTAHKLFPSCAVFLCDVEDEAQIITVRNEIGALIDAQNGGRIDGLVHSIAFANYSDGLKPFHQTMIHSPLFDFHSTAIEGLQRRFDA